MTGASGWKCPGCSACYAPSVTECHRCAPVEVDADPRPSPATATCICGPGVRRVRLPQCHRRECPCFTVADADWCVAKFQHIWRPFWIGDADGKWVDLADVQS